MYTLHSYIKLPDDEGVSCMDHHGSCIHSFTLLFALLMILNYLWHLEWDQAPMLAGSQPSFGAAWTFRVSPVVFLAG